MTVMDSRKFMSIPLSTFIGGTRAVVDLYVKLAEDHYIKVVNAGTDFDVQRLATYQDREVTHLYVLADHFKLFVRQSTKISELVALSKAGLRQKTAVLLRTAEHVFTEMADLGVNPVSFGHAVHISQSVLAIVESQPDLADVLDELSKYGEDFVRHSMMTSILAGMLVQALRWNGKKTLSTAALGGLLHDIGMRELPPELRAKPRSQMTPEEIELFESHPMRGYMLLKEMPNIPPEVLAVVSEHHELASGTGFPRRLKSEKIFPLSQAVAFADRLAELILSGGENSTTRDLKSAIQHLSHTVAHDFPPIYFEAAERLLHQEEENQKIAA
jgi:putative nucleotidyltransferase with HDIG domain